MVPNGKISCPGPWPIISDLHIYSTVYHQLPPSHCTRFKLTVRLLRAIKVFQEKVAFQICWLAWRVCPVVALIPGGKSRTMRL